MLTYRLPSALRLFAMLFALAAGLAIVLEALLSDAQAQTAPQYTFTKVADSVEDGFDPSSFGCAAINTRGDIAFKAGRLAPDGFNTTPGIYRANADGTLRTIAEDPKAFEVRMSGGDSHTFDSFECAIHALAPVCEYCGVKVIGHGVEADGHFYCCAHCASMAGAEGVADRA